MNPVHASFFGPDGVMFQTNDLSGRGEGFLGTFLHGFTAIG